jgi:hypothetical protein
MAGLALAAVLAACAPAFEPELSEDFSRRAEQTAQYFFRVQASGTNLTLQPDNNYVPQTITITTTAYETTSPGTTSTDFNLYIDPALTEKNIPGLGLYPVIGGAEDGSTPITHNTAVPLKYIATYATRNTVVLRIPFNERTSITTKKVALVLDPAVVSFNGAGNHRLNMDGNTEYGQADDIFIKYYSVLGNTVVTPNITAPTDEPAGYYALPPQYIGTVAGTTGSPLELTAPSITGPTTATEAVWVAGGNKLVIEGLSDFTPSTGDPTFHPGSGGSAAGPKNGNFDKEIISKGYKFQKFDYEKKEWVDVSFTVGDIDTTNNYTDGAFVVTFAESSKAYDMFRYSVNPYEIVEKNAVLGYRHRLSYDSSLGFSTWDGFDWIGGEWDQNHTDLSVMVNYSATADQYYEFTAGDFSALDLAGIQGRQFITVTISESSIPSREPGSLYFDTGTLTAKNVTVVREYNGAATDDRAAALPLTDADLVSIGRNEFRIYLPADLKLETGDTLDVYINAVKVNYKTTAPKTFEGVILADPAASNGAIKLTITVP